MKQTISMKQTIANQLGAWREDLQELESELQEKEREAAVCQFNQI